MRARLEISGYVFSLVPTRYSRTSWDFFNIFVDCMEISLTLSTNLIEVSKICFLGDSNLVQNLGMASSYPSSHFSSLIFKV